MDDVWVEQDDGDFERENSRRKNYQQQDYQRQEEPEPPAPKMGFEAKAAQAQVSLGDDLWELHAAAAKIIEFTTGRTLDDYEEAEVLRAVVASMLGVMAAAYARIATQSAELGTRLAAPELTTLVERMTTTAAVPDREVWRFVQESLPDLLVRATTELEAWHAG